MAASRGVDHVVLSVREMYAARDFSLSMAQEAKGLYTAKVKFRLKGLWDILVSVRSGEDEFNIGERINVVAPY